MKMQRLESWTWKLIYIGLGLLGLGLSLQHGDALLGWGMVALGGAAVVAGAVLIWVRSRLKNNP